MNVLFKFPNIEDVLMNLEMYNFVLGNPPNDDKERLCFCATALRADENYSDHRSRGGSMVQRGYISGNYFKNHNGFIGWRWRVICYCPVPVKSVWPVYQNQWDDLLESILITRKVNFEI